MLALGIIMVMSASSPTSLAEEGNSYEYVKTQALSAGLGLIAMFVISKIDYKIYKKFYKIIELYIPVYPNRWLLVRSVPCMCDRKQGVCL